MRCYWMLGYVSSRRGIMWSSCWGGWGGGGRIENMNIPGRNMITVNAGFDEIEVTNKMLS